MPVWGPWLWRRQTASSSSSTKPPNSSNSDDTVQRTNKSTTGIQPRLAAVLAHVLLARCVPPDDRTASASIADLLNSPHDNDGSTPLHVLACVGETGAVREVVSGGGAVDEWDVYGRTPLLWAVRAEKIETVMCC
ncbi:hypothetical protein B0H63DRAFT_449481 [Podospora didyma]|uniref:Ankyrin repeat protein n=1 Tax=Podospora didyma TaxID=330526 RepID=A0AAE0NPR3_9PEZI|nr:hypothetical protein B0H63DRAFT_449481 [Podospora didyma]